MLAALRSLQEASSPKQAIQRLQEIHRLVAAELPVIPLWQLVDYFAYHNSVKGMQSRPLSLYQDIENWQVELRIPSE